MSGMKTATRYVMRTEDGRQIYSSYNGVYSIGKTAECDRLCYQHNGDGMGDVNSMAARITKKLGVKVVPVTNGTVDYFEVM